MKSVKEINELRVLSAVRVDGPISRASLARKLRLSRAAITGITQRLVERNLLVEVGKGASTQRGGRREVLLALNPNAGTILSIEIEWDYARYGLLDMNARIIEKRQFSFQAGTSPLKILNPIMNGFKELLRLYSIDKSRILGIGIGIPGILNYEVGTISEAFSLDSWRGFTLRSYLEDLWDVPAFLENNVKMLTLGEHQFGSGRNSRNFVSLWVGDGIGAGIIVNGRLMRGVTSSAGEIGYNETFYNQESLLSLLADKKNRDLGDILSHVNLRAAVRRGLDAGWTTNLTSESAISDIIDAAEAGDPLGLHVLKKFAWLLGTICSNLILTLNPSVLSLNGQLFTQTALVANEVRERVAHGILRSPIEGVEIHTGLLGENAVLQGGAALILDDLFQLPEYQVKSRSQKIFMEQAMA